MVSLLMGTNLVDKIAGALCNTLVSSMWQGVLLAAAAGLIVICTRRLSAALRYNLLVSAVLLFAAGVVITFISQFEATQSTENGSVLVNSATQYPSGLHTYSSATGAPSASWVMVFTSWLNTHYSTIVLVWFFIICAKSIQWGVGLQGTCRLKRANVFAVTSYWQQRMQQFATGLSIKQGITLLESGLAKVPLVIGHLKPVILLPAGLLTSLTPEK